ncbi:MAG: type 4a pilus biogenesis protein PilO [Candidatus Bipolaricaulia bacterium]
MKFKEYFTKLSKREKTIVYVTAVIVFFGLVDRLVYYPIVNHFKELDQEILIQEKQLRTNWRHLAAQEAVRKAYSAFDGYALTAGSDEEEVASLLNEIEGLARKTGLSLANVKPKPLTKKEYWKQYPVEIEVETEWAPLIKFIHGLTSSKYLLRVKHLRLMPKGKRTTRIRGYLIINKSVIQTG